MQASHKVFKMMKSKNSSFISHRTTLYDVIMAINEEVPPEEDALVTETVLHLINTGQIKKSNTRRRNCSSSAGVSPLNSEVYKARKGYENDSRFTCPRGSKTQNFG